MAEFLCPACKADPRPFGKGSQGRNCAFKASGKFALSNWNCATMTPLREIGEARNPTVDEGQSIAVIPFDRGDGGMFLILSWYKNLGATEGAWVANGTIMLPLTLATAERLVGAR